MAAVLGGTMRSPMMAVIFALELTHDWAMALPLLTVRAAGEVVGLLTLEDARKACVRHLEEEQRRERVFPRRARKGLTLS